MAMDAKDLRTGSALGERGNDGTSKFVQNSAAVPCNNNKTYQDLSTNPLSKVDAPTSRPCAVIGPDRVLPQPTNSDAYLKKNHYEPWPPLDNTYRQPPEYPHKLPSYQSPIRNISPRQTFQENMQRIMVPPTYNTINMNEDTNYMLDRNISQSKNKLNVPFEAKYCDVPYTVNPISDNQKNAEICVPNINNPRNCPPTWHPGSMNVRPTRPYGASEVYQYPEYANCSGPRPVPISRPQRNSEDGSHIYADAYYSEGNVRFKPYPNVKDRYPQARYEYVSNYTNPFHPPQPFPSHNIQKNLPHPSYPQMPIKYLENRMGDPIIDGYQRQQLNYNVPYRNQMIHPAYGPMLPNGLQNKLYPYPPEGPIKNIPSNKLPYENNKVFIDYENSRNKVFTGPENYYVNDMGRPHLKSQVLVPNYSSVNMQTMPSHPYYRKENHLPKTYDYPPHFRHMDPSINVNHLTRLSAQFSPTAIAISPSDSNTSNETAHTQGTSLEDCGYVSQSSAASVRSIESGLTRVTPNDINRRYNYPFPHMMRTPLTSKSELHPNSKDKKGIDVRQFLQSWNEGDEESGGNTKEIVTSEYNDRSKSLSHYESVKSQEQLYVLGLVNVPSEELGKYEHIQKISKLPDNIKGYNNIELLKQFEEAIESSNLTNLNQKPRHYQMPIKRPLSQGTNHSMRPVSPLDVEAKISQSVIHKEVGCNFEIKPCSPPMLNVEVATPAQNILGERIIEKVSNPLILKSPVVTNLTQNETMSNTIKHPEHISVMNENLKIHSCKMINTQCSTNDTIDTNKPNYCLQDLESNSGVCLASLPRLDNDIELNFPEVNQQFINANKVDSVIITNELSNNSEIVSNMNFNAQVKGETNRNSKSSDIELEKDLPKLSKYRKNKNVENKETYSNSQCLRTDSVIIKNPDNIKSFDEINNCLSNIDDVAKTKDSSIFDPLSMNTTVTESGQENETNCGETSNDMAIDFSLNKNDNVLPHNRTVKDADPDKKSSFEMNDVNINKASFEQSIIKNYNPVADDYSTICGSIESSVVFPDKFENKTIENIDEKYNTAEKNSIKMLHTNNLSFSNNKTCESDGMTTNNHVDIKNTQSCSEIGDNSISSNSNKTIYEISKQYDTQVDTRTSIHLSNTDYESSLMETSNNIQLNDFPKKIIKEQNNEKISKHYKSNVCDLKSSDTQKIYCSDSNTYQSESEIHIKIIKSQKNKYGVRTSDESIKTDLDNMDLKILEDSTNGFLNNTNKAFSVTAIMSMDSKKTCLLKKELFSPWIQKLIFYSEGVCSHLLDVKLPLCNSMLICRNFPQYETIPVHKEFTRSSNVIEAKSPDIVSDQTNHDTWFNSSDNENIMSSEVDNFSEGPNISFEVDLEVEKYKLFDEKKQSIVTREEKEKSKHSMPSDCRQMNDQEEFKKVSHEKKSLISNENEIVNISTSNNLQVDKQEIKNTLDEDKGANDTLNEIDKILNYNIPVIEIKNETEITSDDKKIKNYTHHEKDNIGENNQPLIDGQTELENTSDKNKLPIDNRTEITTKEQLNNHQNEIENMLEYNQLLIQSQEEITYTSDKKLTNYNKIVIEQILNHNKQQMESQENKNKADTKKSNSNKNKIIKTVEHNKQTLESLKTIDNKCAEKLLNDNQNEIEIILEDNKQLPHSQKTMSNKLKETNTTNYNQNKFETIVEQNKQPFEGQEEMFIKFEEEKPTEDNQNDHNKKPLERQEEIFNKLEEMKPTNDNQDEIESIVEHKEHYIESQEEMFNKLEENQIETQEEMFNKLEENQIESQEEMSNKLEEMKPTNDNQNKIESIVEHKEHSIESQVEMFNHLEGKPIENQEKISNKLEEKKPTNDNQNKIESIVEHKEHSIESQVEMFNNLEDKPIENQEKMPNKLEERKPTNDNLNQIEIKVEHNKHENECQGEVFITLEEKQPTNDTKKGIEIFMENNKQSSSESESREDIFNKSEEHKPTNDNQKEIKRIVEHNKQSIERREEMFYKSEDNKPTNDNIYEIKRIVKHNKQIIESQEEIVHKLEEKKQPEDNQNEFEKIAKYKEQPIENQEEIHNNLEKKKPTNDNRIEIKRIVALSKQPDKIQKEMKIKPEKKIQPNENPKEIDKESEHNLLTIVETKNLTHFGSHEELRDSLCKTKLSIDNQKEIENIADEAEPRNNMELSEFNEVSIDVQKEIESKVDVNKVQSFENYHYADITGTKKISLKRSLSDSAIDLLDTCDIHNSSYDQLEYGSNLRKKRRKHLLSNICNSQCERATNSVQNNRRNSISSTYNEENLSFCIVIDDNCIITEENEEDKICYAELPENCLDDVNNHSTDEENLKFPTQIILCQQEDSCTYHEPFVLEIPENKPFAESWIDDVACVETVVSDDVAEDITLSAPSSPKDLEESDDEDSDILNNISEHTEKVKYIYGDKMCNDDVELLETLFRTPQMNVNKTLTSRESHDNDCDRSERNNFLQITNSPDTDKFHPEHISTESTEFSNSLEKTVEHAVQLLSENVLVSDQEHGQRSYLSSNSSIAYTNTQDDTVNSCESSVDDVFSNGQETDSFNYNASSSPEVSSTTSEEKNSTILLKITNYKGMRKSQLNDDSSDKKNNTCSKSCKFTENINYTNYPNSSKPRPLITKAAQKYIPPAKHPIEDLKVKLVLPQQSLLKLKQLKKSRTKPNQDICQKKDIPKKIKPRFEDVLKSIDEIQIQMHKEKTKKPKKSVPKVVIKKNGNGSHYASTSDKDSFNPDLTGRKWQPWVFIEKNGFIDKMALKKKSKAIFNHRKNTYVFADKFKKYKSISNTKFVISQPKSDESAVGHLKYTIRLKHAY